MTQNTGQPMNITTQLEHIVPRWTKMGLINIRHLSAITAIKYNGLCEKGWFS